MWKRIVSFALGEGPKGTPPERVRWLIVEQQVRSEILIGWVGFALVLFFLVLYTVSPKTSAGTRFVPVPWVLAAFLGVTALRLALAYRRWLSPPFLIAGVCLDIALLLGLIWSFHLQYQQPAPFYLKVPTLLYVFIFIALRALRFEPVYVIAAGLSAAAGWLAMLAYAATSGEMVVTRDYVRYMTSNSVLIGAEIDKIIAILMVTGVLARARARARRLRFSAVLGSGRAQDLARVASAASAAATTCWTACSPRICRASSHRRWPRASAPRSAGCGPAKARCARRRCCSPISKASPPSRRRSRPSSW